MRHREHRIPSTDVTFDPKIGLFKARDCGRTTCIALGRTPEEALTILSRVRSRRLELADEAETSE